MVSTFSPSIQLEEPARGDQVGVWDTPVNSNMTIIDRILGATATIALNNTPVVLASAQFQSKAITFNSTLTGSVAITFPTSFTKSYEVYNSCTGSSAFVITLTTTAAAGQVICCPPGETVDVVNDGVNLRYKNLDRVGTYWDFGGSSVPAWVSGCTVPPYLNCDATAFSSVIYPNLANFLGSTTLPDSRGRSRMALNQGTNRVTSGVSGVDGNTIRSGGGDQNYQQHNHVNVLNDPAHAHTTPVVSAGVSPPGPNSGSASNALVNAGTVTGNSLTGMSITNANAGIGGSANVPPRYVGGLTLIRAG